MRYILPFLLLSSTAFAANIENFLSASELVSTPIQEAECSPGNLFALFDKNATSAHAIGKALRYENERCVLKIKSHSNSLMVRPGDLLVALDLTKKEEHLDGRFDLILEGEKKLSSRYKPLVYGGYLFGQTASTLNKKEFLLGIGPLAYGITDHLQFDTIPLLALTKIVQMGAKYRIDLNEDMRLTPHIKGYRFFSIGKGAWEAALLLDSTSNSRSMTHTRLTYRSKFPDALFLASKATENKASVELSTIYEWMLPSWNRILFGPKFITGDKTDLGASFSYIWIFNSFHAALNLEVNTVRKIDLKNSGQSISFDLFWRL
jgi:hypothetical protein